MQTRQQSKVHHLYFTKTEITPSAAENEVDIFTAAQYGDFQRIEGLITSGAVTASEKNDQGITPLHWAV